MPVIIMLQRVVVVQTPVCEHPVVNMVATMKPKSGKQTSLDTNKRLVGY